MKRTLLLLAIVILLQGCAKIVTPIGGPRDTTPPKVIQEQPENGSTEFKDNQIKITFDEFVTTNAPTENVLISPPLQKQPDFVLNGKSLIIKFKDSLRTNTTYNIVFSHFIKDYHEGNPLAYYHYSFSTGDAIDSFRIEGNILDANTLEPQADFFVMLYEKDIDSLPLTTRPDYITKSLHDGSFSFRNIRPGDYKIFALKDINNNLIYDLPNEAIAFSDQPISAFYKNDTLPNDSLLAKYDSLKPVQLLSFTERDPNLKLLKTENPQSGIYNFHYNESFTQFTAIPASKEIDFFQIISHTSDTVTWYLKQSLTDTITYYLQADDRRDTVLITPYRPKPNTGRGRGDNEEIPRLGIKFINTEELYKPLAIKFNYPIKPVKEFHVTSWTQQKSSSDTMQYSISVPDTFVMELPLPIAFEGKKNYTILISDSIFEGYNKLTHDTLKTSFITKSEKDYGNLTINYVLPQNEQQYIVQLWKDKILVEETILAKSQTIYYKHLDPGNYQVKAIEDLNRNGLWDTGEYRIHKQPEAVKILKNPISLRAFWDIEEEFEIPE